MFVLGLLATLSAAPVPDCTGPEHRQFDFWLGDWDVAEKGQAGGRNRIESAYKGCAVVENWTDPAGWHGTSLNFYDRATKSWYQTWVDERGVVLRLKGGLVGGRMVMQSEPLAGAGGASTIQRITWSAEPDKSVRQVWETSKDGGATWTAVFDGRYTRR
jgi:hypothetical protein